MALIADDEMLVNLGIKRAEPFDWGDEPKMTDDVGKQKHPAHADGPLSGLDSLKKFVGEDNGENEKRILWSLFEDAGVDITTPVPPSAAGSSSSALEQALMGDTLRDVSIKGLSDRAVAELTVESKTSLFGSILRLFDMPREGEENPAATSNKKSDVVMKDASSDKEKVGGAAATPVLQSDDPMIMTEPILSTAEIVRSVHLTARPGDVPAGMDSKEYTLAAIHFLASHVPYLHEDESEYRTDFTTGSQEGWDQLRETLPVLPLLKAINPNESLELRCYGRVRPLVKLGETERNQYADAMDRDEAFRRKVLNLERLYSTSLPFSSPCTTARLQSKLSLTSTQSFALASTARSGNDLPFSFQRYVPRRKLLPNIEGGYKEELMLMISGHTQQPSHTPGPKKKATPAAAKAAKPVGTAADKDSLLSLAKRKADTAPDGLLHQPAKKGKECVI